MFAFGHVGLTWGGALLLVEASRRLTAFKPERSGPVPDGEGADRPRTAAGLDYRFLVLGSILPDLIDKPLGVFILREQLSNGRTFAHSLLFPFAIGMTSMAWRGRARRGLTPLALGAAAHLVLDRMWMQTDVLFWPSWGWLPERQDVSHWLDQMLELLFADPYTYVSEAVGAGVVAGLLASLLMRRGLRAFVLSGQMGRRLGGLSGSGLAAWEERPHQLKRGERPAER